MQVEEPFAFDVGRLSSWPGTALSHLVAGADGLDLTGALVHALLLLRRARPPELFAGFGGSEHGTLRGILLLRESVCSQEILLTLGIALLQFLDYYVLVSDVGCLEGLVASVRGGRFYHRISICMLIVDWSIIHF